MLLPLSFLLLASPLTMFPEAVHAFGNPVLDVKGFPLLPGFPYYIISTQWPLDSGIISLGKGENDTCPLDVILLEQFGATGNPVNISIASGEGSFITDFTDVYISFNATSSSCPNESLVWMHGKNDTTTEFLTIGGFEGDVNTVFRIVKDGQFGFNYKLVAYKLSYPGLLLSIADVGISDDFTSGLRRLALTEPPLSVVFQPAEGLRDM